MLQITRSFAIAGAVVASVDEEQRVARAAKGFGQRQHHPAVASPSMEHNQCRCREAASARNEPALQMLVVGRW